MSRLVMIDSQLFIWGIKGQASLGQEDKIQTSKRFIDWLSIHDCKILLPAPLMAELLSGVPPDEQRAVKDFFDKRFRVAPFDTLAAEVCAELLYDSYNDEDLKAFRKEHKVLKSSIKYDCMLVAIAITNRVEVIYSVDKDLKRYANDRIHVMEPPHMPTQSEIGQQLSIFPALGPDVEETGFDKSPLLNNQIFEVQSKEYSQEK
ncbi:hypothetical protein ACFS7Z_07055 [Pontibacter toksunensis]|uniref:PIN domain-containing protein n=1 Tax=Pontibacter toksunensis TaxID=1332631 RepID=A0ABW6BT30_9BACT